MLKKIALFLLVILIAAGCMHTGFIKHPPTPVIKEIYFEALRSQGKKEYDNAIKACKKIIKLDDRFYPAYRSLAEVYTAKEEFEEAIIYLNGLIDGANPYPAWALGLVYDKKGNHVKADGFYKQSIEIDDTFYGAFKGLVDTSLKGLGGENGALDEVERYLRKLIELEPDNGGAHYGLGYLFARRYKYHEGLAECFKAVKNTPQPVMVYEIISEILFYQSDYRRGIEYLKKSLVLYKKIGDIQREAATLNHMGIMYGVLSDYPKALEFFEKVLNINKNFRNKRLQASTLNNLGMVYERLFKYPKALEYFEKSLIHNKEGNHKRSVGDSFINIGMIYSNLSNYLKALDYYEKGLSIKKEIGDKNGIGLALFEIGNIYTHLSDDLTALEYFNEALVIQKDIGEKLVEGLSLSSIGLAYFNLQDYSKALEYLNKSLIIHREIGNKLTEGRTLNNIGLVYYKLSNTQEALEYYNKAAAIRREIGDREGESITYAYMGNVHLTLNGYENALSYYQKAITITESLRSSFKNEEFKTGFFQKQTGVYENIIQCLYELHQQNSSKGFDQLAFTYAEKSKARGLLDLLAESRANIRQGIDPDLRKQEQALEREYARINSELQAVLSRSTARVDKNQVPVLKSSLEAVNDQLEQLKVKIIRNNPRYAELKYPEPVTSTQIQQSLLDENTLLVEYKITGEFLFAWRITKGESHFFKLDIGEGELTDRVLALRNTFSVIGEEDVVTSRASELYNLILGPLLDNFGRKNDIFIIPDGILHYLPFETLVSGETGPEQTFEQLPFLIKEYTIRYAQSASVAYHLTQKISPPAADELFAMGDPVFFGKKSGSGSGYIRSALSDEERSKLKRLIYSGEEVKSISRLFNKPAVYLREEATEECLKSIELENYRYIHLATHGLLNEENPRFSGIILTLDDDPGEDGFLLTREIFNIKLNADLVVLSACSTGLGKHVAGEGIVGFARAWLYAGASSLVVSLWNINDRSTSYLMEGFYNKIRGGMVYDRALREAKLELIEEWDYAHPYYWAGFVLIGGK